MKNCVLLSDEELLSAFSGLYPGDISEYTADGKIAAGWLSDEGKPAALFLSTIDGEDLFIDWFIVDPAERHKGIGSQFMDQVILNIAEATGLKYVHTVCSDGDMFGLLIRQGFLLETDPSSVTEVYTATLAGIGELPAADDRDNVFRLTDLSGREIKRIEHMLLTADEEISALPIPMSTERYLDISYVFLADDEVKAMLLLSEDDTAVNVEFAYTRKNVARYLLKLASIAVEELRERYGDEKVIRVSCINKRSSQFARKLFPEAERIELYLGTKQIA